MIGDVRKLLVARRVLERKASLAGFEPATHCLEGSCSIHLSYRDTLPLYCTDEISRRSRKLIGAKHSDRHLTMKFWLD